MTEEDYWTLIIALKVNDKLCALRSNFKDAMRKQREGIAFLFSSTMFVSIIQKELYFPNLLSNYTINVNEQLIVRTTMRNPYQPIQ